MQLKELGEREVKRKKKGKEEKRVSRSVRGVYFLFMFKLLLLAAAYKNLL